MVKLGVENFFFKIPTCRTVFNFSCKTSGFCGAGCSFGYLFCQFCGIFSCKTSAFCGVGWSFWVKKTLFFHAKLQFLRAWVVFLVPFFSFFGHFFMQNFSFWRGWEVFLSKKRQYFHAKLQFLRGWMLFLSTKTTINWDFLKNVGWRRNP